MQQYSNSLFRQFPNSVTGNAATGVSVNVYEFGTTNRATLYADDDLGGATLPNPLTTNDIGFYSFYAPDGKYTLNFSSSQFPDLNIQLIDALSLVNEFNTAQAATGFILIDNGFSAGYTVTQRNEALLDGGIYYVWKGSLPKTVAAGSSAATTGGVGNGAWQAVLDNTLRQQLSDGTADIAGQTAQSVADLRGDLADGTADVGGVPASRLADTVIQVSHLKSLPTTGLVDCQQYIVAGFYAGSNLGGGTFVYDASRSWADHNGGTVIAPPAIAAWDGTQADIATLLNWTPTGGVGCWVRVGSEVLIEDFGAVVGGGDCSLCILKAVSAAKALSAVNATVRSELTGVVYIGSKMAITACNLVMPFVLFRLMGSNAFATNDIIFDINYSGFGTSSNSTTILCVDGDNVDLIKNLTLVKVDNAQSAHTTVFVQASNTYKGFVVGELLERASITVSGNAVEILCDDGSSASVGGGDENNILVRGSNCGTYYRNHGQTSSSVTFGIETNNASYGRNAVEIRTGKSCSLGGIVRGIVGNAVYVNEESGRNGRVHFDDLQIIQVSEGTGLKVDRITGMSGNVYIEKCQTNGIAAEIGLTKEASSLNIYAAEGDADCGIPVILGHASASGSMENTKINLNISYANAAGIALQIDRVLYTNIDAFMCFGNIDITANVSRAKIALQGEFLRNNRQVINAASAGRISIDVQGVLDFATVIVPTWYFKGVTFPDVRNIGFDATNVYSLKFVEYVESRPQFECTNGTIKSTTTSLGNAANVINTNFKVIGVVLYDTASGKALAISGNTTTSPFNNVGTGVATITPA